MRRDAPRRAHASDGIAARGHRSGNGPAALFRRPGIGPRPGSPSCSTRSEGGSTSAAWVEAAVTNPRPRPRPGGARLLSSFLCARAPPPCRVPRRSKPSSRRGAARAAARARRHHHRLVNEAARSRSTRSRLDAELRALKANLLELTASVVRLRTQVREIEIQGESQIQSRMSHASHDAEGFDPLEFDRYTRFQELTRSLAEASRRRTCSRRCSRTSTMPSRAARASTLHRDIQQQLFAIRTVPFAASPSGCTGFCARSRRSTTSAPISRSAAPRSSSTAPCSKSSPARSST